MLENLTYFSRNASGRQPRAGQFSNVDTTSLKAASVPKGLEMPRNHPLAVGSGKGGRKAGRHFFV
jgi:hypothetical protein